MSRLLCRSILISSLALFEKQKFKKCLCKESVDENFVIDLTENWKLSDEQSSNVLKERFSSVRGLSSRSVRRFCSKRSISLIVSTEKVTEMVMEASSKVISALWLWCIWRNWWRFFYYRFKILSPLFYSNSRCFTYNSLSIPNMLKQR